MPSDVVTETSTVPLPAGEVAVITSSLWTEMLVASCVPNLTAVAPLKPAPLMVTTVPPAAGPDVGVMLPMAGALAVPE